MVQNNFHENVLAFIIQNHVEKSSLVADQLPASKTQAEMVNLVDHFFHLLSYFPTLLLYY